MQQLLQCKEDFLTPNELIVYILKAPVDLLWNGGIGTYVKATNETDADVSDKSNDSIRVNGKQLRAKAIGEGGNLGVTQRGRVEYALAGGLCLPAACYTPIRSIIRRGSTARTMKSISKSCCRNWSVPNV